ncbi:HU family DNA-binding protein [Segatella paludivivens]|jgi:DNA-binding protein HU-beta|uniref:HU family DNA-binding protein n=1 Tax=Segatella paludivivens TaxID=185294 RepID=UPI000369F8FF|nr:HU family DNA-binding protein [Segatella paludivivens]
MNNKEFISELAQRSGYTQADTQRLVNTVIASMGDAFEGGENVALSGFGSFEVKKRMERVVINPVTGLKMLVPPKLVLGFKPIAAIKEKLKNGGEAHE